MCFLKQEAVHAVRAGEEPRERQLFFMSLREGLWGLGVGLSCSWL